MVLKISEPVKCFACLLIGMLIGLSFGLRVRSRPSAPEVRAVASVEPLPMLQSRIPANLLDQRKVCKLAVGERGWVSALHLRIDRESKVWLDPNATCLMRELMRESSFVPVGEVVNLSDGLHLYITTDALAWATLTSSIEPDSNWLVFAQIHKSQ